MGGNKVVKNFKVIGVKSSGAFTEYAKEVPKTAKQFMSRVHEIPHHTNIEVALYEPKRDDRHEEGSYYTGVLVDAVPNQIPEGMTLVQQTFQYVTMRGKMDEIGHLHEQLNTWSQEQGYQKNKDGYIIETYHPTENGEEEVEIYIPVK